MGGQKSPGIQYHQMQHKQAILTGITGQDGAFLAQYLLEKNYQVTGILHPGRNSDQYRLRYLKIQTEINFVEIDITSRENAQKLFTQYHPDEFYHLAGQSSVAESYKAPFPSLDYNINSILVLLESLRESGISTRLYYSSSSEIFGNAIKLPVTLQSPIDPVNPYGLSKASGFAMIRMFRQIYGVHAASGIVFNHESYLRPDHFFIKKVIKSALLISEGKMEQLHVGNIDIRRDFGDAREYVKAFWHMMQLEHPEDFIISSGTSYSLREIIYYVFDQLGVDHARVISDPGLYRPVDALNMVGDNSPIMEKTGWKYSVSFYKVLDALIEEERQNIGLG
jgi:GDPmannose 4,6-dehydratase